MRFDRSPFARFGTQVVLLIVAIPVASKASVAAARGLGTLLAVLAIGAAVAAPIALDLWAMVAADREGIRWRNRLVVRKLPWSAVAGFADGLGGTVLRKTDGGEVRLRVLGSRYLGSRRLAAQRVHVLEQLRRGAA
ncbi:MAG: hypothetical protein JO291_07000 [Acidimicrobiia bacterium]|nr:hypothetical protein [Acidimicrobiia bacterium]